VPQQADFANVPNVHPAAQFDGLRQHPGRILTIAQATLAADEFEMRSDEVVGGLGTLNIRLADEDYQRGETALLLAAATCLLLLPAPGLLFNLAAAPVFALILGAIYAGLYVTWTPLGDDIVRGPQGRYFLPLLTVAPLLLPALVPPRWGLKPAPAALRMGLAMLIGLTGWGLMIWVVVNALYRLSEAYGPLLAGGWWQ